MFEMALDRRALLECVGATVVAATVTQTVAADEESADDPPSYSRWMTPDEAGSIAFAYLDWARIEALATGGSRDPEAVEEDESDAVRNDPMHAYPMVGLETVVLVLGQAVTRYGLAGLVGAGDPGRPDELASKAERILVTPDVLVAEGTILPGEIGDRLTRDPVTAAPTGMERADDIGAYDVYTDDEIAVAVADDGVLFELGSGGPAGSTTTLESAIDARHGDVDRAVDVSESVAWLTGTAGHGHVAVGTYRDPGAVVDEPGEGGGANDTNVEALADATGLVSSITYEDVETANGSLAAIVPEPDVGALEASVGSSADERSIDVDGELVSATASWADADPGTPSNADPLAGKRTGFYPV